MLRAEDDGYAIFRDGERLAGARTQQRPRFYDLKPPTASPTGRSPCCTWTRCASTVVQTCAYWGNEDQCTFCGIGVSLDSGRTIVKKSPEQLAEVAVAAKRSGRRRGRDADDRQLQRRDRGALYVAQCGQAVKEATGCRSRCSSSRRDDLDVIDQVADMGIDSVGIHIETFDPAVLARVAPAKARTGIERYFAAWERAVDAFGAGQVSTYVILGMGEDPELTVEGCRRAVDMGVYPFIVPLRPVAGQPDGGHPPAGPPQYTERIYRRWRAYMAERASELATSPRPDARGVRRARR